MAAMEIKLMIDPKSNKVIFAEASKDFVDFLIFLLSLPIGTAIKLLTTESMVGSIGNVYTSVANLNETYLQPNINKNVLLNPLFFSSVQQIPLLSINESSIISLGKFYSCAGSNCKIGITNVPYGASCPDCNGNMSKEIKFYGSHTFVTPRVTDKNLEGYVKKEASYMILDDLSVTLISTMSILSMMKKFNVSELQETIVKIGNDEALELLKASLQSTTVLTDVFRKMEDGQDDAMAEAIKEIKDESNVEQNEEMNNGKKEPEADKPHDMKKNEKAKEREEDSEVLKKHPEPEGKGCKKENIKKGETSKKKEEEPKTPNPTIVYRPVHERKSVEGLVAVIDTDYSKEFRIEKGRGTALKDIPNVAFKLSRRKCDDTCKLLHTILFGRRGKAALIKRNISRFSGFVWRNNEDKQKSKTKEKLDRCNKEKLLDFCEILDIQVSKENLAKRDEVIVKLMEFLEAPHATTSELLSDTSSIPKPSPTKTAKRPRDSDITSSDPNGSKKKKSEPVIKKDSAPKKPASKEITGTKNEKPKNKSEEEAFKPSDDKLKVAICDILKEADFSTATFSDIYKQLAKQFKSDMTARKSSIKLMIENELIQWLDEERPCQ